MPRIDRSDLDLPTVTAVALTALGGVALYASIDDTVRGRRDIQTKVKGVVGAGMVIGGLGLARIVKAEHTNRNFIDHVYRGV